MDVPIEAYLVDNGYYVSGMHQHKVRRLSDEVRDVNEGKAYLIWGIAKPSKLRDAMRENYISEAWITYDCNYLWQDSQYARKHLKEFQKARDLFEDTISQKTFDDYLKIYDGDIFGDLENIVDGTYYNDLTSVVSGGAFVDCGAYNGDSVLAFVSHYGRDRKIFAFEPDRANYDLMVKKLQGLEFIPICAGVWSTDTMMHFSATKDMSSNVRWDGDIQICMKTVDEVVKGETVSFIKMDVEGSELEALKGSAQTIKRDMPILAISAYHKQEDLITLPRFIHSMENDKFYYKLYLRHHGCTIPELVIYGIPTKK